MDCIFCKIVAGEIPSYKVWEDDQVLAFLDIHPCTKGHTVMIPKKHFTELSEMSTADWEAVARGLQAVLERVQSVLKPDGVNIAINNGKAAGQAVGHTHWHFLPRWEGDGGNSIHAIIRKGDGVDVKETAKIFE